MKKHLLLMMLFFVMLDLFPQTIKYNFPQLGYSINSIDKIENDYGAIFAMTLPPSDNFAPNVNVAIQKYKGSIDEYWELSKVQFQKYGYTLINNMNNGNECYFEYKSDRAPNPFYYVARAIKSDDKVYLVTGTMLQSQSSDIKSKLMMCVKSLEVN